LPTPIAHHLRHEVLRRPIESTQYASLVYGAYAKQSGIDLSMGSIGDPWDNALAESFFASLEKELLRRERFATREQARLRVFWYVECFYNPRRRHSSLGMLSPIDYEHLHANMLTHETILEERAAYPKVSTKPG
jgi:putative transposase